MPKQRNKSADSARWKLETWITRSSCYTDGPYAEVKEALGGYFILDCPTIDDAVEWAARIPAATYGAIEVRPVHVDEEA